jgi:hypothetical protein
MKLRVNIASEIEDFNVVPTMTPKSRLFLGTDYAVCCCAKNFQMESSPMFWSRVRASDSSDSTDFYY